MAGVDLAEQGGGHGLDTDPEVRALLVRMYDEAPSVPDEVLKTAMLDFRLTMFVNDGVPGDPEDTLPDRADGRFITSGELETYLQHERAFLEANPDRTDAYPFSLQRRSPVQRAMTLFGLGRTSLK